MSWQALVGSEAHTSQLRAQEKHEAEIRNKHVAGEANKP